MFSLKSPPPSLKSPPGKILTDKCPSIVVSPASHESGGSKPHDPRLGLLQLAPAPAAAAPKSPPRHSGNDIEDISDGEKDPVEVVSQTLEERLRALDEKYEKWSGSTKHAVATTPVGSSTPSSTPTIASTPSLPSVTPVLSSACPSSSSASSASSSFKFNFDLKQSQPSAIVQRLLVKIS